ncbi:MAG: DUF3857 domain-containing protein [Bacteroidota bacterium]
MKYTTAISLLFLFSMLSAQDASEIEFGIIPPEDLAMARLESDTSAGAYVLHDEVRHRIEEHRRFFTLYTTVHRRLKFFSSSEFDRADIDIQYMIETQEVKNVEAAIYLPDGNKYVLTEDDFIEEDLDKDIAVVKFTFPQVTEGAIIEYRYDMTDENIFQLSRYYFQEDIPVRCAVFDAYAEILTTYIAISNSFEEMSVNEKKDVFKEKNGKKDLDRIEGTQFRFEMRDLDAFDPEPYVNNLSDYIPYVFLQLESYISPYLLERRPYMGTWFSVAYKLLEHENIGERFLDRLQAERLSDQVEPLIGNTEVEKAQHALNLINEHMEWNGEYSFGIDRQLKNAWKDGIANSGAMNMMLYVILAANDIEVRPVLTGLRDYGRPIMAYPLIRQFQHLMVLATLDGKEYLLDADGYKSEVGLPRHDALNESAWVFTDTTNYWINVQAPLVTTLYKVSGQIDANGNCQLHIKNQCKQYSALRAYNDLKDTTDLIEGPVIDGLLDKFPETELISRDYDTWTDPTQPLTVEIDAQSQIGESYDDFIYLKPILFDVFESELVENNDRQFPLDFAYPFKQIYIADFTIPEGYVVDELPESIRLKSPDESIQVQFMINHDPASRIIHVNFSVRVAKAIFPAHQYDILREIFKQVVDVQEGVVVLRRG